MSIIDKLFGTANPVQDQLQQQVDQLSQSLQANNAQNIFGGYAVGGGLQQGTPLHAGANPPMHHTAGTIWFDVNTGDLKTYDTTTGSWVSVANVNQQFTPEEAKELADLEADRARESKRLKIEAFKKLPAPLRQQIVDEITWLQEHNKISITEAPKSQRQQELEQKQASQYNPWNSPNQWSIGRLQNPFITSTGMEQAMTWRRFTLPNGLTDDDILKAHNDACAEETLLSSDRSDNSPGE